MGTVVKQPHYTNEGGGRKRKRLKTTASRPTQLVLGATPNVKGKTKTKMSTQEEHANIGKVLSFLREWDRGDRTVRGRMLNTFLHTNTGKTFYELELEFAEVASLFLARLTTWMRLTYPFFIHGVGSG